MKKVILINKKEGQTPLEALENFRTKNSKYLKISMTYAGRLDPMASGLLLVLAGDEVKNKEEYLRLNKEYKFEILFGFSTDTYDILGKIISKKQSIIKNKKALEKEIKKNLKIFTGEIIQKYPMYSSKTIKGKPLFVYTRNGEDVKIPEKKVLIKKLKLEKIKEINSKKLLENIEKRIKKVYGDFRQKDILKIWRQNLKSDSKYYLASFIIKCSSGTYVRTISNSLGISLGIPALAYRIKRIKIGKYVL